MLRQPPCIVLRLRVLEHTASESLVPSHAAASRSLSSFNTHRTSVSKSSPSHIDSYFIFNESTEHYLPPPSSEPLIAASCLVNSCNYSKTNIGASSLLAKCPSCQLTSSFKALMNTVVWPHPILHLPPTPTRNIAPLTLAL